MISGAVILSLLMPMQIQASEPQRFNVHQGYLVNATINTARIIGLPNLDRKSRKNPESNSDDVVWLVSQSLNYQKMISRREKFIRELIHGKTE